MMRTAQRFLDTFGRLEPWRRRFWRSTAVFFSTSSLSEVLKRAPYGTQVDCFSIGVVLFQMLTGVAPFRAPTQREAPPERGGVETGCRPEESWGARALDGILGGAQRALERVRHKY